MKHLKSGFLSDLESIREQLPIVLHEETLTIKESELLLNLLKYTILVIKEHKEKQNANRQTSE